jgi:arylsulfatase A-like enzyme
MRVPARIVLASMVALMVGLIPMTVGQTAQAIIPPDIPGAAAQTSARESSATKPRADERPNIIVIVTDDQSANLMAVMTKTRALLGGHGITFDNAHATTPTCCPARATLLTGEPAGQTGVWTNWTPYGGWEVFHQGGAEDRTFVRKLDEAGYTTALVGRYLNGYAIPTAREEYAGTVDYVPQGWDVWHSFALPPNPPPGARHQAYFDYWLMNSTNGGRDVDYSYQGTSPRFYSTDYLAARATSLIRTTPREDPLFILYAPVAPHGPYTAAPRHRKERLPQVPVPGYNQVAGKPEWIRERSPLAPQAGPNLVRKQQRTLLAVDDAVASIVRTLRSTDRLDNTLFIFTSDNGLAQGQFRLIDSKNWPYVTAVPFIVRWDARVKKDGALAGSTDNRLVSLSDVASTVLSAAGLPHDREESLDLLDHSEARPELLIGAWRNRGENSRMPAYCGIRNERWMYVRYAEGTEELYQIGRDPGMLRNLASDDSSKPTLHRLRAMTRDQCVPTPPGFAW